MQFYAIAAALFAASAAAAPASTLGGDSAAQALQQLQAQGGCDILGCVLAIGEDALSCVLDIASNGLDIDNDIACIQSVLGEVADPPATCSACL